MNDIVIIENKIYEIRGQKVMLDFDLAEMYEVTTSIKPLNETSNDFLQDSCFN